MKKQDIEIYDKKQDITGGVQGLNQTPSRLTICLTDTITGSQTETSKLVSATSHSRPQGSSDHAPLAKKIKLESENQEAEGIDAAYILTMGRGENVHEKHCWMATKLFVKLMLIFAMSHGSNRND